LDAQGFFYAFYKLTDMIKLLAASKKKVYWAKSNGSGRTVPGQPNSAPWRRNEKKK
jgi:hypothetical protein